VSWREVAQDQNLRLAKELLDRQGQINQLQAANKRATDLVARWRARGDERCADELEAALQQPAPPSGEETTHV
jgi:hypothetical protein